MGRDQVVRVRKATGQRDGEAGRGLQQELWFGRLTVSVWLSNLGSTKKPSGATPVFLTVTSKAVEVKAGDESVVEESGRSLLTLTWLKADRPRERVGSFIAHHRVGPSPAPLPTAPVWELRGTAA